MDRRKDQENNFIFLCAGWWGHHTVSSLQNSGFSKRRLSLLVLCLFTLTILLSLTPCSADRSAATWNDLGKLYYGQGRYDDALNAFQNAVRIDKLNAEAWNNLGVTYQTQGIFNEAMMAFKTATLLSGGYTPVWNRWYNIGITNIGFGYHAITPTGSDSSDSWSYVPDDNRNNGPGEFPGKDPCNVDRGSDSFTPGHDTGRDGPDNGRDSGRDSFAPGHDAGREGPDTGRDSGRDSFTPGHDAGRDGPDAGRDSGRNSFDSAIDIGRSGPDTGHDSGRDSFGSGPDSGRDGPGY